VEAPATLDVVPSSGKKLMAHPPKPYDIIKGMERVIDMMEKTLQLCEQASAQRKTRHTARPSRLVCGLPATCTNNMRQSRSRSNLCNINHLATSRSNQTPVATPSTYHASTTKGERHMLRGYRPRKIDQERDVARATQAPTSLDGGEFQKARIRISPNN
jgi:hypothetical protein